MKKLSASQIVLLSFLAAILCGAGLLMLPAALKDGQKISFIDSLFTSTSATCVTGLTVKDTGTFFSNFGQAVILLFIQLGGLGIMTFSTLFAVFLGRKMTMSQSLNTKDALGVDGIDGLKELIVYIVLIAFGIELIGAVILYLRLSATTQLPCLSMIKNATFHSVSAFCNAGLSLYPDNLTSWRNDAILMLTIIGLIIIGGLGFVVILNMPRLRFYIPFFRARNLARQAQSGIKNPLVHKINLQTKVVLLVTAVLLLIGTAAVLLFEYNGTLQGMTWKEKFLSAFFTAVTPRTAGFNVISTAGLQVATKFLIIILMFIGASPGSTGGGIKTVTLAVLMTGFFAMLKSRDRIFLFGRTVTKDAFRRAVAVFVLAAGLIAVSTLLLAITEKACSGANDFFLNMLFETTSAFGTCGLSADVTPQLSALGKIIIIITMFVGRVGPLTAALALAMRPEKKIDYCYPEEKIMIG
ncbi:MAG: potassium transporter TrkG [Candidatus Omnitrophota bacterium]